MAKTLYGLVIVAACSLVSFVVILSFQRAADTPSIVNVESEQPAPRLTVQKESISQQTSLTETTTKNVSPPFTLLTPTDLQNLSRLALVEYLQQVHEFFSGTEQSMLAFDNQAFNRTGDISLFSKNAELKALYDVAQVSPKAAFDFYSQTLQPLSDNQDDGFISYVIMTTFEQLPNDNDYDFGDEIVEWHNEGNPPNAFFWMILRESSKLEQLSPQVKQELIAQFIAGDIEAYDYLREAGWAGELQPHEILASFLSLSPMNANFPMDILVKVVGQDNPESYDHLLRFLVDNPRRYRIHELLKRNNRLPLRSTVEQLPSNPASLEEQISIALIKIQYGDKGSLEFLMQQEGKYVQLGQQINFKRSAFQAVEFPDQVEQREQWVLSNLQQLTFNEGSGRFER